MNSNLKKIIESQDKQIKNLEKQIGNLEGVIKEKSKPSFIKADIPIYHHKSGQKEGHEGVSRETPEKIDEVKEHKLCKCPISSSLKCPAN